MANPWYNYGSSYGGAGISSAYTTRTTSDLYSDAALISSSRYLTPESNYSSPFDRTSSLYPSHSDSHRLPGPEAFPTSNVTGGFVPSPSPWAGLDGFSAASAADPVMLSGVKRPAEALNHQTVLGTRNAIGQSEALFSTNSFAKHPRLETASSIHNYTQRPGEKDCPHYMMTKTCKFGALCKFDHPLWVPEGGLPGWKEIPVIHTSESLPERPGEPDCPFFMLTQICKFGPRCKFNHPKDKTNASSSGVGGEDLQTPTGHDPGSLEKLGSSVMDNVVAGGDSKPANQFVPFTPASQHNSKGLPIRLGETDCPFYLKFGSCKFGAICRYNHPERNDIIPPVVTALAHALVPSPSTNLPIGVLNPAANILPNMDPFLTQTSVSTGVTVYPQRPGQLECDFYMKTGQCKFGERCKFHHPIDWTAPMSQELNVKLTLAGLPRREGIVPCSYYMKTGTCNYGVKCRFDHPPPGEAVALATVQGNAAGSGGGAGVETPGDGREDTDDDSEEQ